MTTSDLKKEMTVSVEAVSSVKKSIQVEVSETVVSDAFNHAIAHLQHEVHLPGFRPGKAPLPLLLKKYEATLHNEVLRSLLPKYSFKAIEDRGLSPLATPTIQDIHFQKDAPLSFMVLVDVQPEIPLATYTGLTLPKQEITITESDIEKGLERLQEKHGYLESYPDNHSIGLSDYVMIDSVGTVGGKPFAGGKQTAYLVCVGSKTDPEIEEALHDKKKGDSFSMDVPLPAHHPARKQGKGIACFKIDVTDTKTKRLPALDDEFAKDLGVASVSELKEKVREALAAEKEASIKKEHKALLVKKLVELHPIEAPQPMIERQLESLSKEINVEHASGALPPDTYKVLQEIAENRVKKTLILAAIAEKEKIEVTDNDIDDALRGYKKIGIPFEKAKRDLQQNPSFLRGFKEGVREDKALERVYLLAQFETVG